MTKRSPLRDGARLTSALVPLWGDHVHAVLLEAEDVVVDTEIRRPRPATTSYEPLDNGMVGSLARPTIHVPTVASERHALREREGCRHVLEGGIACRCRWHPDLRHFRGIRLGAATIERASDPHAERRLDVCIALTASCNDGTRGIWASAVVVGTVRVLA
jgi:hypothetical protein